MRERQQEFWVATGSLPGVPRHVFYERLNGVLAEDGFDAFAEECCEPFYAASAGRDSIPPGVYFRMLFVVYHGNKSDSATLLASVTSVQENLDEAGVDRDIEEVVADKGYHKNEGSFPIPG